MTPPSSIEEAAKRVLELAEQATAGPWDADAPDRGCGCRFIEGPGGEAIVERSLPVASADERFIAEVRTLAPQLAQWVEKALPVIEAAKIVAITSVAGRGSFSVGTENPDFLIVPRLNVEDLRASLSALAVEGTEPTSATPESPPR